MTDRTQAIAQRRNLLRIEQELDKQISQMQKLKQTTRGHIEDIEREYGLGRTGCEFPLRDFDAEAPPIAPPA